MVPEFYSNVLYSFPHILQPLSITSYLFINLILLLCTISPSSISSCLISVLTHPSPSYVWVKTHTLWKDSDICWPIACFDLTFFHLRASTHWLHWFISRVGSPLWFAPRFTQLDRWTSLAVSTLAFPWASLTSTQITRPRCPTRVINLTVSLRASLISTQTTPLHWLLKISSELNGGAMRMNPVLLDASPGFSRMKQFFPSAVYRWALWGPSPS